MIPLDEIYRGTQWPKSVVEELRACQRYYNVAMGKFVLEYLDRPRRRRRLLLCR